MEQLQSWLKTRCGENNLSWREASIKAGLNPGAISAIMNDQRPGLETCKALARLFHISPVLILQMAGHIEESPIRNDLWLDPQFRDIADFYAQMTPESRSILRHIAWRFGPGRGVHLEEPEE